MTTGIMRSFAIITFLVSLLGFYIFHLAAKRKYVEHAVREETGERHAAKKHVPDMAGVVMLFVYAIIFPLYIGFVVRINLLTDWNFLIFYFAPLFFGGIGLIDDIIKRRSKSTRGLRALIRLPLQALVAIIVCYAITLNVYQDQGLTFQNVLSFVGLGVIFILATINSANFTDGLDGLLTGCAIIAIWGIMVLAYPAGLLHLVYPSVFLSFSHDFISDPLWLYSIIPVSIMIAFLFFNTYPARMFMGDTGSMFIGSFLALLPMVSDNIIPFFIIAFMIYFSLISVVLQVISFRLFKRRIFPMTPFHHSFEKWGWHENHIVWFYYFLSVIFAVLAINYIPASLR